MSGYCDIYYNIFLKKLSITRGFRFSNGRIPSNLIKSLKILNFTQDTLKILSLPV